MKATSTGRSELFHRLVHLLQKTTTHTEVWTGLLLMDIRDFSNINRLYGFSSGDGILHSIEEKLHELTPHENCVFKLGDDEYALVLPELTTPDILSMAANQLAVAISQPLHINDHAITITINVGGCLASQADSCEHLILAAEHALKQAKQLNLRYYQEDISSQSTVSDEIQLRNDFVDALSHNKLELFYQPKISLNGGNGYHAEALLRWNHPQRGFIAPDQFLPICEQLGRNMGLTHWVINTALRHLHQWTGKEVPHISLNISADTIDSPELAEIIRNGMKIWNIDPSQLTLEITESAVISDMQSGCQTLSMLRDLGIKISIDDFGTGYSSLEYFKHIPADELKVDRTFISNMDHDEDDKKITRLIIELAHSFNLSVVAEGIENKAVIDELSAMKCDFGQGYHIARPMPYDDYTLWCKKN